MNRSLRSTRIKGVIGLGVLASLLLLYVLGPRFSEPNRIRNDIDGVKAAELLTTARVTSLKERASKINDARKQLDNYNKRYPTTAALGEFQTALTKTAERTGLGSGNIISVNTQNPVKFGGTDPNAKPDATTPTGPEMWQMSVTLQVRSNSYATLARFATALYTMDRAFVIDSLNMTQVAQDMGGGYSMSIEGRAFLLQGTDSKLVN